jgi:uncharacterized protein YhdP
VNETTVPSPSYRGDNRNLCDWLLEQLDRLEARRSDVEHAAGSGLPPAELAVRRQALIEDYRRLHEELRRGLTARGIAAAA